MSDESKFFSRVHLNRAGWALIVLLVAAGLRSDRFLSLLGNGPSVISIKEFFASGTEINHGVILLVFLLFAATIWIIWPEYSAKQSVDMDARLKHIKKVVSRITVTSIKSNQPTEQLRILYSLTRWYEVYKRHGGEDKGRSPQELCEDTGLNIMTTEKQLERLEKKGLVTIVKEPTKTIVKLLKSGIAYAEKIGLRNYLPDM